MLKQILLACCFMAFSPTNGAAGTRGPVVHQFIDKAVKYAWKECEHFGGWQVMHMGPEQYISICIESLPSDVGPAFYSALHAEDDCRKKFAKKTGWSVVHQYNKPEEYHCIAQEEHHNPEHKDATVDEKTAQ